ncbi:molybdate ABC transporter substrate-binding protein [Heyndrickxia faecalis]|uniref:molybdate ABC transporter substrate-binding protein n=1 Tax=Heyndrickxia faecalis TaxID=2824910 RepID=UPI0032B22BBB
MKRFGMTLLCLFLLAGCSAQGSASGSAKKQSKQTEISVAAASDLTKSFQQINKQFEKKTGIKVKLVFAASGELEQQIENGAPYDVFAAANADYVNQLADKNMLVPGTKTVYAYGKIGIAAKQSSHLSIHSLKDLTRPEVKKIAIANPETAPYGLAAKQALQKAGIWDKVKPKLVYAKNIADTLTYVKSGNTEAGIVSLSLAQGEKLDVANISSSLYNPLKQMAAVVKSSKKQAAAKKFVQYLASKEAQNTMKKYGYAVSAGQ